MRLKGCRTWEVPARMAEEIPDAPPKVEAVAESIPETQAPMINGHHKPPFGRRFELANEEFDTHQTACRWPS